MSDQKTSGEPVAWIKEHWSGKHADFQYKSLTDVVFKEDWRPLYAEQPAPVAANSQAMTELRHIFDSSKGADGTLVISKKLAAQLLADQAATLAKSGHRA